MADGAANKVADDGEKPIDPRQIQGLKRLRHLLPLLAGLHEVGCERDKAGNRGLHFDEYVTLVLLWLFNPMLDSVRALQKAGELEKVSEQLGVKRFSLGSFSESVRVFDPEKLRAVVQQLAGELEGQLKPVNADPRLKDHLAGKSLTMADGTVLDAIATVARATWLRFQDGSTKHAWKLHLQLDFDTLLPDPGGIELTDARNSGDSDEKFVLRKHLKKDCCYVTDTGTRVRVRPVHALQRHPPHRQQLRLPGEGEQRLRGHRGAAALGRGDQGRRGPGRGGDDGAEQQGGRQAGPPDPHHRHRGRAAREAGRAEGQDGGAGEQGHRRHRHRPAAPAGRGHRTALPAPLLHRDLLPLLQAGPGLPAPAEPQARGHPDPGLLCRHRLHAIACLLLNLWTGKKPTKRTVEMLAFYFMGVATERELLEHLNRPDNTGVKLRAKDELWKKLGV